jgi:hypothetical protein
MGTIWASGAFFFQALLAVENVHLIYSYKLLTHWIIGPFPSSNLVSVNSKVGL